MKKSNMTKAFDRKASMGLRAYATGGPVKGPGGPRADAIDAKLSNGEYVLPADVVKKIGKPNLDELLEEHHSPHIDRDSDGELGENGAGDRLLNSLRHFADGGVVQPRPQSTYQTFANRGKAIDDAVNGGQPAAAPAPAAPAPATSDLPPAPVGDFSDAFKAKYHIGADGKIAPPPSLFQRAKTAVGLRDGGTVADAWRYADGGVVQPRPQSTYQILATRGKALDDAIEGGQPASPAPAPTTSDLPPASAGDFSDAFKAKYHIGADGKMAPPPSLFQRAKTAVGLRDGGTVGDAWHYADGGMVDRVRAAVGNFISGNPAAPAAPAAAPASAATPFPTIDGGAPAGATTPPPTATAAAPAPAPAPASPLRTPGPITSAATRAGQAVAPYVPKAFGAPTLGGTLAAAGAVAAPVGKYWDALNDPNIPAHIKAGMVADTAVRGAGAIVGGAAGATMGSAIPVAGTVAGALGGAYAGDRLGNSAGSVLRGGANMINGAFGGDPHYFKGIDETLQANGYNPNPSVADMIHGNPKAEGQAAPAASVAANPAAAAQVAPVAANPASAPDARQPGFLDQIEGVQAPGGTAGSAATGQVGPSSDTTYHSGEWERGMYTPQGAQAPGDAAGSATRGPIDPKSVSIDPSGNWERDPNAPPEPQGVQAPAAPAPQRPAPAAGQPGGALKVVNSVAADGSPLRSITGSSGRTAAEQNRDPLVEGSDAQRLIQARGRAQEEMRNPRATEPAAESGMPPNAAYDLRNQSQGDPSTWSGMFSQSRDRRQGNVEQALAERRRASIASEASTRFGHQITARGQDIQGALGGRRNELEERGQNLQNDQSQSRNRLEARGQDLTHGDSRYRSDAEFGMRVNQQQLARDQFNQSKREADFRDNQTANEGLSKKLGEFFTIPTKDAQGNVTAVPDKAKVGDFLQHASETMGQEEATMSNIASNPRVDAGVRQRAAAQAKMMRTRNVANLDPDTLNDYISKYNVKQRINQSRGMMPGTGTAMDSQNLHDYQLRPVTGVLGQRRYETYNKYKAGGANRGGTGGSVSASDLAYADGPSNLALPDINRVPTHIFDRAKQ